jgi:UDP-galactopyranose mutase
MRIPIRYTWNDDYFDDQYQGIPIGGYTNMFYRMVQNVEVKLETDFFADKKNNMKLAKKVVYSGKIDEFFDYKHGELEYRSLRFEHETIDQPDYQGTSIMNYTNVEVPYTRIVEHKHFEFANAPKTVITREYPQEYTKDRVPYYPVNNDKTREIYLKYAEEGRKSGVVFGGRLGSYQYYDMDQTIANALSLAKKEFV